MRLPWSPLRRCGVAPLAGSVDRNVEYASNAQQYYVAPLAGSVDRNRSTLTQEIDTYVAPLAGSVDRNQSYGAVYVEDGESLPSRGAWIEMRWAWARPFLASVAPLAGSVDRNLPSLPS